MLKHILFSIIILFNIIFISNKSFSQDVGFASSTPLFDETQDTSVKSFVQIPAKAPYDFNKFLSENLKYPSEANENNIEGIVNLQFIVELDGSIRDIKVLKGKNLGFGLPEEAIRVLKKAPKWTPAYDKGKAVRSYFRIPIKFKLTN